MEISNNKKYHNTNFQAEMLRLSLDRDSDISLKNQIIESFRALILSGRAPGGTRLPASRQLAAELGVSRITTLAALDQLAAEGYLQTRRGAGTYVAHDLPHLSNAPRSAAPVSAPDERETIQPFHPAQPDLSAFPHAEWAQLLSQVWRNPEPALLGRADPLGWPPLRHAIAAHLSAWRHVTCHAGQVVITAGSGEAFRLIAGLLPEGSDILTEEPGFAPMRHALQYHGHYCTGLPVDDDGFDPALAGPGAAVVVTPSRQYPLGMTMPLSRRLALLEWADRHDALVVEDDYDSEFRYTGQPLPALASLSHSERVIYVGSFSKLLSPGLRLGYIVVPERLIPAIRSSLNKIGPLASLTPQPALARFMESGAFATHLRRMRRTYLGRQKALLQALAPYQDLIITAPDSGGMHLVCPLGSALLGKIPDREIAKEAKDIGLSVRAISQYFQNFNAKEGLILGYAGFDEATLTDSAAKLVKLLRRLARS